MNLYGWIFMLVSWGLIIGLFVYCMIRILTAKKQPDDKDNHPEDL